MNRLIPPAAAALLVVAFASSPAGAQQTTPFENCPAAYAAGRSHIPAGDPAYGPHLDRDDDGIGCDQPPAGFVPAAPASPTTVQPAPEAALPTTTAKRTPPPTTTTGKAPSAVRTKPRYTG